MGLSSGSVDKDKEARRKALCEGRVDAEAVVTELLKGVDLDNAVHDAAAETSGLQLFVVEDGTVTLDKNCSRLSKNYEPVVIIIDGPS